MRALVGTSGFSYPAWKGRFYPADLPASRMLRFYAGRFATVEINATFYRMPTPATLASWAAEVPDGFAFALKAPQRVTHQKRLADVDQPVGAFYRAAAELGAKLGPVLYQLPPQMKKDAARLRDFLATLPAGGRAAFEFRHPSWFSDDVLDALRAQGAALCIAESDELSTPLIATAPFGYLRLRRLDYGDRELAAWAERLQAQAWSDAFVYFKHEDQARGPAFADAFSRLVR